MVKVNLWNYTKLPYDNDKWYRVDAFIDWEENWTAFFIDGVFLGNTLFYSYQRDEQLMCDESFVNALMLYTLTPNKSSSFKDIRLCEELCSGSLDDDFLFIIPGDTELEEGAKGYDAEVLTDPFVTLTYSISGAVQTLSSLALTLWLATSLSLY